MAKTYIIAEAGVNHNGDESLALQLVDCAKQAGADAIKFQLFKADALVTLQAEQAEYQKNSKEKDQTQHTLLRGLELPYSSFYRLQEAAKKAEIDFIVTPFDLQSLEFLVQELKLLTIKIGSGDITNGPLLLACGRSQVKVILSTGMSMIEEVAAALNTLAYGLMQYPDNPTPEILSSMASHQTAQILLKQKVSLLHCVSEYPAPVEEMNLKAIDTLQRTFDLPVGLSDHTIGIEISLAAVAREATIIEKHFTLNKTLPGPDHRASLNPEELSQMVRGIRAIEKALGNGEKVPSPSEKKNAVLVRRMIVASQDIAKGEIFTVDNLTVKRPCAGASPMEYWQWLGKSAPRNYQKDEAIT